ncbi:MAG: DEAD/DEAH box helicase, partial [Deltaproteobacteria bacterium]
MQYKNLTLDPFQAEAIEHVKARKSVLVSAPTGVGKTIIADFVVEQAIRQGERVIYTAPIKALSNQKYREFTRDHDPSLIGLVTGDLVLNHDAPVVIMTTEILRNMLLQQEAGLDRLAYVIFDEIHFLGDPERGTVWEETLIYLPHSVKILGLSATLSNIHEFARWLSFVREEEVKVIVEKARKVPLEILIANRDAGILPPDLFRKRFERKLSRLQRRIQEEGWNFRSTAVIKATTRHFEVVEMIRKDYLPCLYFVFSRRLTETYARDLERHTQTSFLTEAERERVDKELTAFLQENTIDLERHAPMYRKGIAFHHAGLDVRLKWLVEHLYEARLIKVLYCTSTFALGMNMPARSVVFDDIRKYDGRSVVPLTTLQFMQKAGRAGRRGMDEKGYVVIKQDFLHFLLNQSHLATYEKGKVERITSSFNLSFNSIVNLIERYPIEAIETIIQKSFRN